MLRNLTRRSNEVLRLHNAQNSEFWWLYPSAGATEITNYVFWSYKYDYWRPATMARLSDASGHFRHALHVRRRRHYLRSRDRQLVSAAPRPMRAASVRDRDTFNDAGARSDPDEKTSAT